MNHPILTALISTGTLVYQVPLSAQESPSNPVLQTIVVPTGVNNPSDLAANERAMLNGPIAQVAQAIEGLKRSGRAQVINDIELTLVENQQARLQVGDRVAMPAGAVQMPGGREAMQFQQVEIGTQMLVKGRASEEHVVLDLEYEKSFQRAGQPDDDSGKPHDISTLTSQLTLRIPNGQAQLAGSMSDRKSDDQATTHLLIVAAENLK